MRARDMGFLISVKKFQYRAIYFECHRLTSNSSNSPATPIMIDDRGIAFYDTIHGKIASVASVGDLSIFERLDGHLNSVQCRTSVFENEHGDLRGTKVDEQDVSQQQNTASWNTHSLHASRCILSF